MRPPGASAGTVADAERQSPLLPVHGIPRDRRADVARPADTGLGHQGPIPRSGGDGDIGRITPARDPVRAAGQGQMAMPVDHARDDRRAARVDDLEIRRRPAAGGNTQTRVLLGIGRADPDDQVVDREDADPELQALAAAVGQRGIAVEDSAGPMVVAHVLARLAPATIDR